ncbi:T9SS type A sorting domain-containing protein [Tenacibaculum sp. TC6]|uniref:T9SS type A sorting domain-containing protein n=1 Tax=Tenacibaculum sp. TC6 TaxID=3423223 RepID=UPI003D36D53E
MRQNYFASVLSIFCVLMLNGQTPFIHIEANMPNSEAITYYGESLQRIQEKDTTSAKMINYHKVISFNGIDDYLEISKSIADLSQVTIFTVFQSEKSSEEKEVWKLQGEESTIGLTTQRTFNSEKEAYYKGTEEGIAILHTYLQLYRTQQALPNSKTFLRIGTIDEKSENRFFKGKFAEFLAFNRRLRGKTRQKYETALAIKYGITLTNGENYITSNKKVIWDAEEDGSYTHNIIGIGRDDEMEVYQKQSTSANAPEFMVLSATQKATSNQQNTSELTNRNFIVVGDNNASLTTRESDGLIFSNRQWMVKTTGVKSKETVTQVQVNVTEMFDQLYELDNYLLVIASEATGDFSTNENNRYIKPNSLSSEGILTFDNLIWNTGKTDKEIFTFAIKKPLEATLTNESPLICPQGYTTLQYEAKGGIAPYTYTLKNNGLAIKEWVSTENLALENIGKGNYTLEVKDYLGDIINAEYTITEQKALTFSLGEDQTLKFEQTLPLQAEISEVDAVEKYEWKNENGEIIGTEKTQEITTSGLYTLSVTTNSGCTYSDSIEIHDSYIRAFTLFPNPTKDGNYSIDVEIGEKANIEVQVFNAVGGVINTYQVKNRNKVSIKGKIIKTTGLYEVILTTPKETVVKKLIVE